MSYADLDAMVSATAAEMRALGAQPGDVHVLWSDNRVEFVVGLLAIARTGGMSAPLNVGLRSAEVDALLERLSPASFIRAKAAPAPPPVRVPVWTLDLTGDGAVDLAGDPIRPASPAEFAVDPAWPALVMSTSGSTGVPKRVPLSRANLAASVRAICAT